jgi:hypothetical protein
MLERTLQFHTAKENIIIMDLFKLIDQYPCMLHVLCWIFHTSNNH